METRAKDGSVSSPARNSYCNQNTAVYLSTCLSCPNNLEKKISLDGTLWEPFSLISGKHISNSMVQVLQVSCREKAFRLWVYSRGDKKHSLSGTGKSKNILGEGGWKQHQFNLAGQRERPRGILGGIGTQHPSEPRPWWTPGLAPSSSKSWGSKELMVYPEATAWL